MGGVRGRVRRLESCSVGRSRPSVTVLRLSRTERNSTLRLDMALLAERERLEKERHLHELNLHQRQLT